MPLFLSSGCDETRATTNAVMAAVEEFVGRLLWGPRQHVVDSAVRPSAMSFTADGERAEKP